MLSTAAAAASLVTCSMVLYVKRRRAWASRHHANQPVYDSPRQWQDLPPELLVAIAHALLPAADCAYEMMVICRAWREAIAQAGDNFWRPIAFARYPRLRKLVRFQPSTRTFKALLKQQMAAERFAKERFSKKMVLNTTGGVCGNGTSACTMRDFLWTFELRRGDEKQSELLASWTGKILHGRTTVKLRVEQSDGRVAPWTKANDPVQAEEDMMSDVAIAVFLTRNLHTRLLGWKDEDDGRWDDESESMSIPFGGIIGLDLAELGELGGRRRYHWRHQPVMKLMLDTSDGELAVSFLWGDEIFGTPDPHLNAEDLTYVLPQLLDNILPRELTEEL